MQNQPTRATTGRWGRYVRRAFTGLAVVACGVVFQIPSCSSLLRIPSLGSALTLFNPCGTIFGFCDPSEIDTLFGTVPDFDIDPTCTIPGFGFDPTVAPGQCATAPVFDSTPGPRP